MWICARAQKGPASDHGVTLCTSPEMQLWSCFFCIRYIQTEHAICNIFLKGSKIYFKNRFCIKLHTQRKNSIVWHLFLNLPLLRCCSLSAISVSCCLWRRILKFLSYGACDATSWVSMMIESRFPRLGWSNRGWLSPVILTVSIVILPVAQMKTSLSRGRAFVEKVTFTWWCAFSQ